MMLVPCHVQLSSPPGGYPWLYPPNLYSPMLRCRSVVAFLALFRCLPTATSPLRLVAVLLVEIVVRFGSVSLVAALCAAEVW